MERINFTYFFENENEKDEEHTVSASKRDINGCGLNCYDICQLFEDFMISAGFSIDNILEYFQN